MFFKLKNYIGTFVTNQYLRIKNWKLNSVLKSKDWSYREFQEKLKKKEIIENLNELVQLLKDEGQCSKIEESSTSPNSYQTTPMDFLERTY